MSIAEELSVRLQSFAKLPRRLGPTEGSLYVEYVIVALCAGVVVAGGLAALGPKIVQAYAERRAVLYSATP